MYRSKSIALLTVSTMVILCLAAFTPSLVFSSPSTVISVINPAIGNTSFTFHTNTTSVGNTFIANITVSNVTSLQAWQVSLTFNPSYLNVKRIFTPADHVLAGRVVLFPDPVINNATGMVFWGASIFSGAPFSGSGRLCQIEFEIMDAPEPGATLSSTLELVETPPYRTFLEDPEGNDIPFTPEHGSYRYISSEEARLATIYVDPPRIVNASLTPCNNFTININILEATQLYAFNFMLNFNATLLSATSVEQGTFFPPTPIPIIEINNTAGTVTFSAMLQSPETPKKGNGTLATITFHVQNLGMCNLTLTETALYNQESQPLPHNTRDGYFNNMLIAKLAVDPPEIIDPTMVPPRTFEINITINDVENMYAYQFTLDYDPNILTCIGIIFLDALNETNYTPQFSVNNTKGSIWVAVNYHPPAQPITTYQPVPFVTLIFRVKGMGATYLDLHDTDLYDSNGQPITHEALDGFFLALIRDVAVINVTASPTKVYAGRSVNINITVKNEGDIAETFNVTAYYDDNPIGTITVENLASDQETTMTLIWNTAGLQPCSNFTISAKAGPLPFEMDQADNTFIDGTVKIKLLGDVNGDGIVDMKDITIIIYAFGTTPGYPRWNPEADLNNDNVVDVKDVTITLRNYGKTC